MPSDSPREYLLELYRGPSTLVDAYVLPNVYSYERRPIPALSREWTAALRPVKQSAGYREEEIRLSGVSGQRPNGLVTVAAATATLTSGVVDGVAYFEGLLAFLKTYEEQAAQFRSVWVQDPARAPNMVFRDLAGGGAWYVDDIQVVPSTRVGASRNSYEYTLSMKTEGAAKAQRYQSLANTPTVAIPAAETSIQDSLRATTMMSSEGQSSLGLASTLSVATSAGAGAAAPLVGGSALSITQILEDLPADMAFYAPPIRRWVVQAENFGHIVAAATRAGLGIPRDAARNFKSYCQAASRVVYDLWDATRDPLRDRARAVMSDLKTGWNELEMNLERLLGAAGSKLGAADQPVTLPSGNTSGAAQAVIVQRLTAGEDLPAFAARVLGDAGRWPEIMSVNGMTSPWQLPDGSPVIAGTPLLVPAAVPDGVERPPDGDPFDIMGTDLLWDFGALDFVVEGDGPTDFLSVSGLPNLKQGLLTRFGTAQGAVLVRPNMGLPNTLGQVATPARAAIKASQVVSQSGADPRIKQVSSVVFTQVANAQLAQIAVVPVTDEGFTIAVPVG